MLKLFISNIYNLSNYGYLARKALLPEVKKIRDELNQSGKTVIDFGCGEKELEYIFENLKADFGE